MIEDECRSSKSLRQFLPFLHSWHTATSTLVVCLIGYRKNANVAFPCSVRGFVQNIPKVDGEQLVRKTCCPVTNIAPFLCRHHQQLFLGRNKKQNAGKRERDTGTYRYCTVAKDTRKQAYSLIDEDHLPVLALHSNY